MTIFKSKQPSLQLPPTQTTLWDFFFSNSTNTTLPHCPPDQPPAGFTNATSNDRLTFPRVKHAATCISTALVKEHGLRPGDCVSLFSRNTIWYPVTMFAVNRIGGIVSGASPAYNVEEMTYALEKAGSKFLFTSPSSIDVAEAAAAKAGLDKSKIFLLEGAKDGYGTVAELVNMGESYGERAQVPPYRLPRGKANTNLCGFLSFSSGTTGLPKAVMISHANVIAQCLQVAQITPAHLRRVLACLPLFHITGLVHQMHLPLLLNAEVFLLPEFSVPALCQTVQDHQITELLLVPPIIIRLVRDPVVDRYDLSHVTRFSSGAAPIAAEVLDQLQKKFPRTGFKQGWGMTESCSCITAHPPEYYDYKYAHAVGTIVADTEMKVIDPATGRELGAGEAGELCARGPQIVMGYLNNAEATAATFDRDGFLHTGDLGMIDAEGLVYVQDRIKELIKVKGIGVAPAELEDLLLGHDTVDDCAVMGVADAYSGERPKAFVVLKPGFDKSVRVGEALMAYVRQKKERNKWVEEVEMVDVIPKSASGKVLRRVLRDQARKGKMDGLVVKAGQRERSML